MQKPELPLLSPPSPLPSLSSPLPLPHSGGSWSSSTGLIVLFVALLLVYLYRNYPHLLLLKEQSSVNE